MRVVGLVSGGKDSCYNMIECVRQGHSVVALANLSPPNNEELDSLMYQSVASEAVPLYASAMRLPLYTRRIDGRSVDSGVDYTPVVGDEVEDLYQLLAEVRDKEAVEAVSVGAILSNYQRVRVENVCNRLGLTVLAYLWRRDQPELLNEMVEAGVDAIIVKIASYGLVPQRHLGKRLADVKDELLRMSEQFQLNPCGEGGEYETLTLDCPLFYNRLLLSDSEIVWHSDDAFAPVCYLRVSCQLESKPDACGNLGQSGVQLPSAQSIRREFQLATKVVTDYNDSTTRQRLRALNLSVPTVDNRDAFDTASCLLRRLSESDAAAAVACVLTVPDMGEFAEVNRAYAERFPTQSPPARACVQVKPSSGVAMEMSVFIADCPVTRMHVRSISHWAPANIGPYSQCVRVSDSLLIVSGQIGMLPATLLVAEGVELQARLSLRHVHRVLTAERSSSQQLVLIVCYALDNAALRASIEAFHELVCQTGSGVCRCAAIVPVLCTGLPKGARVEWLTIANCSSTCGSVQVEESAGVRTVRLLDTHKRRLAVATFAFDASDLPSPSPSSILSVAFASDGGSLDHLAGLRVTEFFDRRITAAGVQLF